MRVARTRRPVHVDQQVGDAPWRQDRLVSAGRQVDAVDCPLEPLRQRRRRAATSMSVKSRVAAPDQADRARSLDLAFISSLPVG